jgi:hypothetical protein
MIGNVVAYLIRIKADGKDNYMIILGGSKEEVLAGTIQAIKDSNEQMPGINATLEDFVSMDEVLATVVGGPPLLILFAPNPAYQRKPEQSGPDIEGDVPEQGGKVVLQ